MSGVFPIRSTMDATLREYPGVTTAISDYSSPRLYQERLRPEIRSLLLDRVPVGVPDLDGAQAELAQRNLDFGTVSHRDHHHLFRDQVLPGHRGRLIDGDGVHLGSVARVVVEPEVVGEHVREVVDGVGARLEGA